MDITFSSEMTVNLVSFNGTDQDIINAARVSVVGEAAYVEHQEATGLINWLMSNRHGTPFEHNSMTFFIKAPIFVFREFHRHRIGWSYNEESGRYKQLAPEFYLPPKSRNLVQTGKTGAYNFEAGEQHQYDMLQISMRDDCKQAYRSYQRRLNAGIAKEVARMTLPVNIYSSMYATCNARSLMAFLSLRTQDDRATFSSKPMWEIENVARQMEAAFAVLFPVTHRAYCANGRVTP